MRGKRAKQIRRAVYGDLSSAPRPLREAHRQGSDEKTGKFLCVLNSEIRTRYRYMKKSWTRRYQ